MVAVIVITRWSAALVALGAMVLLVVVAHLLIVSAQPRSSEEQSQDNVAMRRRGVKALVMGADGRASTSKLQAVLWTFAVFYAFVFLLVWGRSLGCDASGLSSEDVASCNRAADDRTSIAEVVGRDLQPDYYVLLGFPLGVAVAARALTTAKVASGAIAKKPNEASDGVAQGLREIISNDRGETDLLDFQYFAFNLVTLAFFWTEFHSNPANGLPDLPATLIGLSGLSAAVDSTRKALEADSKPLISAVVPRRIALVEGSHIAVIGTGFGGREPVEAGDDDASAGAWVVPPAWVKVDGTDLKIRRWESTRIDALITDEFLEHYMTDGDGSAAAELVVDMQDGLPSEPFTVELVRGGPARTPAGDGA
jgi:hypothetical protein